MYAAADDKDTGFGARLRAVREAKGLTVTELAELAGMVPPVVSRLESGGRTPNWATVIALAESLGVTPNDFLPPAEPPDDPPPRPVGKRK